MTCTRRAALLASLTAIAAARASVAATAWPRLRPGAPGEVGFSVLPQERLAFHAAGIPGTVVLPAARARIAALLPLGDRDVAVLAFAADPGPTRAGTLDLAAVVGWDGVALRVLALEVLRWQAARGDRMTTRVFAVGDRSRLRLERDGAVAGSGLAWRHESWTDYLAWQPGGALPDAPPRPPREGTMQALLQAARGRTIDRLGQFTDCINEDLVALCRPPPLF